MGEKPHAETTEIIEKPNNEAPKAELGEKPAEFDINEVFKYVQTATENARTFFQERGSEVLGRLGEKFRPKVEAAVQTATQTLSNAFKQFSATTSVRSSGFYGQDRLTPNQIAQMAERTAEIEEKWAAEAEERRAENQARKEEVGSSNRLHEEFALRERGVREARRQETLARQQKTAGEARDKLYNGYKNSTLSDVVAAKHQEIEFVKQGKIEEAAELNKTIREKLWKEMSGVRSGDGTGNNPLSTLKYQDVDRLMAEADDVIKEEDSAGKKEPPKGGHFPSKFSKEKNAEQEPQSGEAVTPATTTTDEAATQPPGSAAKTSETGTTESTSAATT